MQVFHSVIAISWLIWISFAMHMDIDVLENDDKEIEIGDKEWL
jgi:hypothetical protein